jgi:hypothetical protein
MTHDDDQMTVQDWCYEIASELADEGLTERSTVNITKLGTRQARVELTGLNGQRITVTVTIEQD